MKNKLQLVGVAMLCLSGIGVKAQYCESGGPINVYDTNLQGLELVGETTTITYVSCGYPSPWDPINEPTGYGTAGFEDQTSQVADLIAGSTYSIDIEWGTCGGDYAYAGTAWIDFNGNQVFESFEVVASYQSGQFGGYFADTYTFTVPTSAMNGTHRMRVIEEEDGMLPLNPCAGFNYGSLTDFGITITGGSDCPVATGFTIDAVGADSISVSWSQGASEVEWVVEYGVSGFTPGTGTMIQNTDMTETINGLTDNTDYDIFVYALCGPGDTSAFIGGTATTNCPAVNGMGMCESFEPGSSTLDCWRIINANGDNRFWTSQGDLQAHTGMYSATLYTDGSGGDNDDWLISPQLTMTGNEVLNFWYSVYSSWEPHNFEVLLSTTGNNPSDFTTVLMAADTYSNFEWQDTTIDLSAYTGDVFIAFHAPSSFEDGYYMFIDDVCIDFCIPTPGTDGQMDVCRADSIVDLNTIITPGMEDIGTWYFPLNQALIDDSTIDYTSLNVGDYDVSYVVVGGCTNDTTTATISIYNAPNSGTGGIIEVCLSQPFDLLSGLMGTVDVNGTWYDPTPSPMTSSYTNSGNLAGVFNYTYVVSNGVCPDETANVSVVVDGTCNFLGVEEAILEAVTVYPNPSSGIAYISGVESEKDYSYEVLDFSGRLVEGKTGFLTSGKETEVDLSNCEAGMYLIRISNAELSKTVRLIVE